MNADMDRQLDDEGAGGTVHIEDRRLSGAINWLWGTLGVVGIMIGVGVYHKLSELNDTLIRAVAKIDVQGDQITELRGEVSRQRDEIGALRAQVYTLEGRTLRGIAEAGRAR